MNASCDEFYRSLLGGKVVRERDPVITRVSNSWLILNVAGGPTDDKPTVTLATPSEPDRASAFMNVRVADIEAVVADWRAKGVIFLAPPVDHGVETRAYARDPDGHLIEGGQLQVPGALRRPDDQSRRSRPHQMRRHFGRNARDPQHALTTVRVRTALSPHPSQRPGADPGRPTPA